MRNELPALADLAAAALTVGVLFVARFAFALRRLRMGGEGPGGTIRNAWGVRTAGYFGDDREPERRHASRQLTIGFAFLAVALALYGWLVSASVLEPFLAQGGLACLGWEWSA